MAHSLENRVPFLDNELVDFASKLPAHFKLGRIGKKKIFQIIIRQCKRTNLRKPEKYY